MKSIRQFPAFEIVLVTVILSIHLYAALSDAYNLPNTWFTRDDAYYYFKVAQNISEGHGSTFDGINLTNGYHPLWMAICVPIFALARLDLILPLRVLVMVMAGFNAATAILIYRFVKNNLSHFVALLAASFWAFNSYIHYIVYQFGLETPLAAFAVILLTHKLSQFEKEWRAKPVSVRQIAALAAIAVVVMFSRLDLIFLAIVAGIWIILRGKPIRFLLPLDMVIIFLSMTASVALRTGIRSYNDLYAGSAIEAAVIALSVKIIALYLFGGYQRPGANPVWKTALRTVLAVTASSIIIAVLHASFLQLGSGRNLPNSAFALDWGISLALILALRLASDWYGGEEINDGVRSLNPAEEIQSNWRPWLSEGLTYFGILGGALGFYVLSNRILFGTYAPVSGQIKRWWGTLGGTVYDNAAPNWASFFGISYRGVYDAWQPTSNFLVWIARHIKPFFPGSNTMDERYYIAMAAVVCLAVLVLLVNIRRAKSKLANMALIPLMAGCAMQILSYTTSGYGGTKEWYWVGQMVLVVLVDSLLVDLLLRPLWKYASSRTALQFASILLGGYLAIRLGSQVRTAMPYHYFSSGRPYMEVLPFLENNTPSGAIIGMTGGGNVGYFIRGRTIVNMDGLINSNDYFKALQSGGAPVYLQEHGLKIIFANPRLLSLPPYDGQFAPYLESYSSYGGKSLMYLLDAPKY